MEVAGGKKRPKSGAERSAKYATQMKDKDYKAWVDKSHEKKGNFMSRLTDQEKDEMRRKDRERKKQKRLEEKILKNNLAKEAYKTIPALSKATSKAFKALPSDPQRAQEVVQGLNRIVEKALGPKEVVEDNTNKVEAGKHKGELKNKVVSFFYQPDISYTCPGKKDYVQVRQKDGSKVKMTKFILVLTLSEAHCEFLKSDPDASISLDAFAKLRPSNVLLRHKMPKNVCVCIYHANITFLIIALHKQFFNFPTNHRELIKLTTCSERNLMNEACQTGACAQCAPLGKVANLLLLLGVSEALAKDLFTSHFWWEKERDQDDKERLRKSEKRHVSLHDMLLQLSQDLMTFKVHMLVKQHQEIEFNRLRTVCLETNCLLQFDFSENAEIQEQDEIQSAHWWHLQVSLFTACAWVGGQTSSFVIVTDYMSHDKYMTTIAMVKILKELLEKHPSINILNLFSDGASQHFQQCYFFNAVTVLPTFLGVNNLKISYDFFATSHGKGAVDGIGGSCKRGVMSKVLSRKAIVRTAEEFALTAASACPGIKFIHVTKAEVESFKEDLDEIVFTGARQLKGIRKVHHMEVCTNILSTFFKSKTDINLPQVLGTHMVQTSAYKGAPTSRTHNFGFE